MLEVQKNETVAVYSLRQVSELMRSAAVWRAMYEATKLVPAPTAEKIFHVIAGGKWSTANHEIHQDTADLMERIDQYHESYVDEWLKRASRHPKFAIQLLMDAEKNRDEHKSNLWRLFEEAGRRRRTTLSGIAMGTTMLAATTAASAIFVSGGSAAIGLGLAAGSASAAFGVGLGASVGLELARNPGAAGRSVAVAVELAGRDASARTLANVERRSIEEMAAHDRVIGKIVRRSMHLSKTLARGSVRKRVARNAARNLATYTSRHNREIISKAAAGRTMLLVRGLGKALPVISVLVDAKREFDFFNEVTAQ